MRARRSFNYKPVHFFCFTDKGTEPLRAWERPCHSKWSINISLRRVANKTCIFSHTTHRYYCFVFGIDFKTFQGKKITME